MIPEIYEYDGVIQIHRFSESKKESVKALIKSIGYDLDIFNEHIEVLYTGRDFKRKFLTFLKELAAVIGNAEGEIICRYELNGKQQMDVFTISEGELYVQEVLQLKSEKRLVE